MAPRIPAGRELLLHDRQLGVRFVAGADEAGRGALAGPIVAAAVLFEPAALTPEHLAGLERLNDSKKLSEARRDELAVIIGAAAVSISVIAISAAEIDEIGIQAANLGGLHRALVKGDATSAAIAAASIIAKTTRDRVMEQLDSVSPGYGFGAHAGYGTAVHKEAITRLGPCRAHRHSFAPISLAA